MISWATAMRTAAPSSDCPALCAALTIRMLTEPMKATSNGIVVRMTVVKPLISGGIYYQATKSLKVVGEGNYAWTKDKESTADKNKTFAPTIGLMLFF